MENMVKSVKFRDCYKHLGSRGRVSGQNESSAKSYKTQGNI